MRTIKADLHNHLRTSSSIREGDFNRAISVAKSRLGSGGIVGIVNFEDNRYEKFVGLKEYSNRIDLGNACYVYDEDILIVKGQEVPTLEGHLLVLGAAQNVHLKAGRNVEDSIKEAKDENGIIIADHPFYRDGLGPFLETSLDTLENIDAIETYNGEAVWIPGLTPIYANSKARSFQERVGMTYGVGGIAVSDGHSFYELGRNWTELDMPFDYSSFKETGEAGDS
jgi:hypothetical protein